MATNRGLGFTPGSSVTGRNLKAMGESVRSRTGGKKGTKNRTLKIDSAFTTGLSLLALKIILWGFVGMVSWTTLWLMHDPWETFGGYLVSRDSPIWGYKNAMAIPGIGPALSSALTSPAIFVSLIVMGVVTAVQVMALIDTANKKHLGLDTKWRSILRTAAGSSWMLELWVVLTEHKIYVGGWNGLRRDFSMGAVAIDRFSFGEIGSAFILMFMAETVITICALFVIALKSSALQKKFNRQAVQAAQA